MLSTACAGQATRRDSVQALAAACLGGAGYRVVSLTRVQSGAFLATATLDSHAVRVILDPGAPYTFLDGEAVRALGYSPESTRKSVSFGGPREPLYRLTLSTFALGTMTTGVTEFGVTRLAEVREAAGLGDSMHLAGIVGRGFLRRCEAMFDIDNDRVFVLEPRPEIPDTTAAPAAEPDTSSVRDVVSEVERRIRAREQRRREAGTEAEAETEPEAETE